MGHDALQGILRTDYAGTLHVSARLLADLIGQGMWAEIVPSTFPGDTVTLALGPPSVSLGAIGSVPATDTPGGPVGRPADARDLDGLVTLTAPITLTGRFIELFGDTRGVHTTSVGGAATVTMVPWWSAERGADEAVPGANVSGPILGLRHHAFDVRLDASSPDALSADDLTALTDALSGQLAAGIVSVLTGLALPLPSSGGLTVTAAALFSDLPNGEPSQLVLGFGGSGTRPLYPLLNPEDDVAIAVSATEFDARVAAGTQKLPKLTMSKDTLVSLNRLKLRLAEGAILLSGELDAFSIPRAEVTFHGPLDPRIDGAGIDAVFAFDSEALRVDVDVDDLFEAFVIGFASLLTAGIATGIGLAVGAAVAGAVGVGIGTGLTIGGTLEAVVASLEADREPGVRESLGETIGAQIVDALASSYPSGFPIAHRDEGVTRISLVPWAGVTAIQLRRDGLMLAGPAVAGIRYVPRSLDVAKVDVQDGAIRRFLFGDPADPKRRFSLTREALTARIEAGDFVVPGTQIVRGRHVYLRDRGEVPSDPSDNLLTLPRMDDAERWPDHSDRAVPDRKRRHRATGPGTIEPL